MLNKRHRARRRNPSLGSFNERAFDRIITSKDKPTVVVWDGKAMKGQACKSKTEQAFKHRRLMRLIRVQKGGKSFSIFGLEMSGRL